MEEKKEREISVKVGRRYRESVFSRKDIDVDNRLIALSFASETEDVIRWEPGVGHYVEVLDHSPGGYDFTRLKRGGSLLVDHDRRDQVGAIREATITADRKSRALVKYGSSVRAREIFQDAVDEIRTNISCGYDVLGMKYDDREKDGLPVYRIKWAPYEISHVSVAADIDVGVGREEDVERVREIKVMLPPEKGARAERPACHSMDDTEPMDPEKCEAGEDCTHARCNTSKKKAPRAMQITSSKEERQMQTEKCNVCAGDIVDGKCTGAKHDELAAAVRKMEGMSASEREKRRVETIDKLCKMNNIGADHRQMWVKQGTELDGVASDILLILEERGKTNPQPQARLGLSGQEVQQYSMLRAINACYEKDWSKAGFELEASRAIATKMNRVPEPHKFYIPYEVLTRPIYGSDGGRGFRDLTAGTTNAGGYLVDTRNMGFIEILRNRSVCLRMGARELTGLTSNVTIPKQTAGATAFWLTNEATQATEGGLTFAQISLSPNHVAAYVEVSRQLLVQSSPGAEGLVTSDLAQQVAIAVDKAGLEGSGTEQPTGISNTASIGSFTGATLSYAYVLDAQTDLATNNIQPIAGGYVATPAAAAICMQRQRFSSTDTPLWIGNIWDGQMVGFRAMSSNQLTAGTMIFGDWSELVLASWGALEVEVNPYANFQAGIVGVRAMYLVDVAVRRAEAFSRATSIT